jgi:hypothetical protein
MDLITGTIEDRYGKTERKHVTLTKDTIRHDREICQTART